MTGGLFGEDYAISDKHIPTQAELNRKGQEYLFNDGAVAFVVKLDSKTAAAPVVREKLLALATDLQTTSRWKKTLEPIKTVARIELASHGIALLMTLRKDQGVKGNEKTIGRMEKGIRKLVPGIVLYKTEEGEYMEGCSVESQLDAFGWERLTGEKVKQRTTKIWQSGIQTVQAEAQTRQITLAMTGLGVILLYGFFGGKQ